jgi:hypothetical protein
MMKKATLLLFACSVSLLSVRSQPPVGAANPYLGQITTQQNGSTVSIGERIYQLSGANLIPNSGFEEGFSGWTDGTAAAEITSANFTLASSGGVSGSPCLLSKSSVGIGGAGSIGTGWAIESGKTYYFAFFVKHQDASVDEDISYEYVKVSLTSSKTNTAEPAYVLNEARVGANGEWTKNEAAFTNTAGYAYVMARFRWLGTALAFDSFALFEATELPNIDVLQAVIGEAEAAYEAGTPGAPALQAAVETAGTFLSGKLAAEVTDAIATLRAAIIAYRYANASPENPLDVTAFVVNPSFESGFTGWTNNEMATQTNSVFPKTGGAYIEKWVNRGSNVLTCGVEQAITGMPNGSYALTATAGNIQQSSTGSTVNNSATPQTGVFLFAGTESVAVDTIKNRTVYFSVLENQTTIGLRGENATGNWVTCDNFRLTYYGFDLTALKASLQELVDSAVTVSGGKMNNELRESLTAAIHTANSANTVGEIALADRQLRDAMAASFISANAYGDLQVAVDAAVDAYADGSGKEAAALNAAVLSAQALAANLNAPVEAVVAGTADVYVAILAFRVANGTGAAPVVATSPLYARGATMAFGRSTIAGVAMESLLEHGFCWSTIPNPTIYDNRATKTFSSNGYIYRIENLTPATVYYMRAYAVTKTYAVGYGDVIKVITIPKGTVTFQLNASVTNAEGHHERIKKAMESAVSYFNNLTSIQNHHLSVNYNAGTPTAEASYGSYMQFGASASYQRTGTALHEMGHTIGVGQHSSWYGPSSPLRETGSSGAWLGERANSIVKFIDNDSTGYLRGDGTHMWPYGINGAHEDDGSELLYTANTLIVQGLGEDGLPPTGGFATPAYTFLHDDTVKYYLKSEADVLAQSSSFLREDAAGNLACSVAGAEEALDNDSAAWRLRFDPTTGYYQIRNAATGKYFTYQVAGANAVRLTTTTAPSANHSFQLMGSRSSVKIGTDENIVSAKGYWIVRPEARLNPPCFVKANGATAVATFNFGDNAAAQRWLLLTENEVAIAAGIAGIVRSVSLSQPTCELEVGETLRLFALVRPESAVNKNVTWSAGNPSVATVDSTGLIAALAVGVAIVTVTTEDGGKADSCKVTVVEKKIEEPVEEPVTAVGSLSAESAWVYVENGVLLVSSPVAERVAVYTTLGSRIYDGKKQAGVAKIILPSLPQQLLIVSGSSGWTKKVLNN